MAWNSSWEDCNFIETPDFFKQILQGCFGLQTASEVKSDLIIGFLLANLPYPPNFRSLGQPHGLQKLVEREREETDNYYTCGTASLPQVKSRWSIHFRWVWARQMKQNTADIVQGWKWIAWKDVVWIINAEWIQSATLYGNRWMCFSRFAFSWVTLCTSTMPSPNKREWEKERVR